MASAHPPSRLAHLDLVRGLAALEVCVAHARGFFFVDYGQSGGGFANMVFYALTGWHHEAVMIFFVLSGYLVGGSVMRDFGQGRWHWPSYLARRLSRLWVVVLPALLLTLLWDSIGAALNPAGYAGASYAELLSGPSTATAPTLVSFLGNLAFLQTIAVPSFGSNGPLWSLANEFWYYLLFPLLAGLVVRGASPMRRAAHGLVAGAIVLLLPSVILLYGLIWLFGVIAWWLQANVRAVADWRIGASAGIATIALLLASRMKLPVPLDFPIGVAFALAIPWLASLHPRGALYRRLSFGLSEISYTLYLVHFPALALIFFAFAGPEQMHLGAASLAMLAAVVVLMLCYATAIWALFERNTGRVLRFVTRTLRLAPPPR